MALALQRRNNSVPPLQLCVCSAVVLFLLLADVTAAFHPLQARQETGVVASTEAFYLRGNPTIKAEKATEPEPEESFESFERRELADDGYQESSANCSANCDVKP